MPAEAASSAPLAARCETLATGVGEAAARQATRTLLASRRPSLIISWGTAGGLDPALKPGTLVVYSQVLDAIDGQCFKTHAGISEGLVAALKPLRAILAAGVSSPIAVTTRLDKETLHKTHGCAVVDMESAAIARVAREAGIPFIAVRAVIDPARSNLPTSAMAGMSDPAHATRATLGVLARRPWELPALCRLAIWYRRSLHMLSSAALMMDNAPGLLAEMKRS